MKKNDALPRVLAEKKEPVVFSSGEVVPPERAMIEVAERTEGADTIYAGTLRARAPGTRITFACPLVFEFAAHRPLGEIRFFVNGFSSFSGSGSFHLEEKEIDSRIPNLRQVHRNFHLPKPTRKGYLTSSLFGVLRLSGTDFYTIGFLGCRDYLTQVRTEVHGNRLRLIAQVQMEDAILAPGATVSLPDIFVSRDIPWKALDRYTRHLSGEMESRPRNRVPAGWCSWYHYFTGIDEKAFLSNLEKARHFKPAVRIFQLDDGYAPTLGTWLDTNKKFPSGLKRLAGQVGDAGFVPGIWTAPFIAKKNAPVVRDNPGWLLKDGRGRAVKAMWNPNWGIFSHAYCLDVSRPDVADYLKTIFGRLHGFGFRFFKLDFLFSACLPGNYHQRHKTSLQIVRAALKTIRQAVGDALILGCGCPLEAGIGIVDSMRVGNDVTPYWSNFIDRVIGGGFEQLSTKNCIRNTLARSFMHGRLFQNDPDCLITRRVKNRLSPTESHTLGRINALSGGPLMISDDLNALHPESLDLLDQVFRLQKAVLAKPRFYFSPDAMVRRMPRVQVALGDRDAYMGVYNFSPYPARVRVDLAAFIDWEAYSVIDHDSRQPARVSGHKLTTREMGRHGASVFYIEKLNGN
jgi:Melibiase